ncbi:MAG: polysaccharide deacetylase family protein [Rhodospirillales bacterium]|nr:polysaccharide deacetylase family protein [Rhodospirillales bacterium]
MGTWPALNEELDAWGEAGRTVTLWWRDDDATETTPALQQLLAISSDTRTPVALAAIPCHMDATLVQGAADCPQVAVLQHGWAHANHAPPDQRQEEYGPHRPQDVMLAELAEGCHRITALPGGLAVLVAPWNRMDPMLIPALPSVGIHAVSTLGPREAAEPVIGVRRVNVHVDIMDWHNTRGFVGDEAALEQVLDHLAARRHGDVDPDEPTGLMTHHPFHDEDCWRFVDTFLRTTREHPAVRWLSAQEAFWP